MSSPFFFQKPPDALVRDNSTVPCLAATNDFQFELELVAAISVGGRSPPQDEAERVPQALLS
jgi:fumarylpyruvate hydrolase